MSKDFRVVMLVGKNDSSNIMYHALKNMFKIEKVIMEAPVSKKRMILNRMKRLGFFTVFGQVLFMIFNKLYARFSGKRINEIKKIDQLDDSPIDKERLLYVSNINDETIIEMLQRLQPDAIVVNGTRIISENVLKCIDRPFLNTHAGITPKYRGVHGGYWALVQGDPKHCGVTVHLVDPGIDTGGILYQDIIEASKIDNFNTYPYLQLAKAIPLMRQALRDIYDNRIKTMEVNMPSSLWYHPTLWSYVINYMKKGVK